MIARLLNGIKWFAVAAAERRRERQVMKTLAALSDSQLRDIGVDPASVDRREPYLFMRDPKRLDIYY